MWHASDNSYISSTFVKNQNFIFESYRKIFCYVNLLNQAMKSFVYIFLVTTLNVFAYFIYIL